MRGILSLRPAPFIPYRSTVGAYEIHCRDSIHREASYRIVEKRNIAARSGALLFAPRIVAEVNSEVVGIFQNRARLNNRCLSIHRVTTIRPQLLPL